METNTSNQVVVETYQKLGRKTLWYFVFERLQPAIAFLGIAVFLFIFQESPSLKTIPIANLENYITMAIWIVLGICIIAFFAAFLISWLFYLNYEFLLSKDALKIKQGVFDKEEVAIPYRQIQNINLSQNFFYRTLGISRLIILTAGHEDEKYLNDEAEGILPVIDTDLAEKLQTELLRRSNIQMVEEEKVSA